MPDDWIGKTLRELSLPRNQGIQVVALFDVLKGRWKVVPDPDEPLTESDVAVVAGHDEVLQRLTRKISRQG